METSAERCITIPPELAKAIVAAQAAVESLRRDNSGENGRYTTADEIAYVARQVLTDNGAAWVRLDVDVVGRGLDHVDADIGKQVYVGDVCERWAIVHSGGGVLLGSSRMPVIVSRGRPHDKAVGAALTYDVGGALRGALCMDREDKNAPDRREDKSEPEHKPKPKPIVREPDPEPEQPRDPVDALGARCTGKAAGIAKANGERMRELIAIRGGKPAELWADVLGEAGIDVSKYGKTPRAEALTIADGQTVKDYLTRVLEPSPAEMESLRNEIAKLWAKLCMGPEGYKLDDWKADYAKFAKIAAWPDQPSAAEYRAAIAGMRAEIAKMNS